jgi:orotate phosphoribosyltransferase
LLVRGADAVEVEAGQFEQGVSMSVQVTAISQSAVAGAPMTRWRLEFVQFAVDSGVLRFGEFKTKAGRMSPYFFNAGLFDDGAKLGRWRNSMPPPAASGIEFDMVFGPAYKGIPLGAACRSSWHGWATTCRLPTTARRPRTMAKGGTLVGAPLKGRVLIVDDVMSAGTAVRESIAVIQAAGATASCRGDCAGPPGKGHRERRRR